MKSFVLNSVIWGYLYFKGFESCLPHNRDNSCFMRVSEGANMQSVFFKQALKKVNMS